MDAISEQYMYISYDNLWYDAESISQCQVRNQIKLFALIILRLKIDQTRENFVKEKIFIKSI